MIILPSAGSHITSRTAVGIDNYISNGNRNLYEGVDYLIEKFRDIFQGPVSPSRSLFLMELVNLRKGKSKKIDSESELEVELNGWFERFSQVKSLSRNKPEELESLKELRDFCVQASKQFMKYDQFLQNLRNPYFSFA